jgi:putative Mg2+ transporter-C (MgtC) family protein
MFEISDNQIIMRLILSVVLSSLIGFERELKGRAAGLRTHVLIGLSTCLLMLVSIFIAGGFGGGYVFDPGRVAAGVVTGIGILCAGTIIRFGTSVKGLTTAASLWAVAALGLAVGAGFYTAAYTATLLILTTLFLLSWFGRNISKAKKEEQ